MNISSRCEYACRAMAELAVHEATQEPMPAAQVADRRSIPEKYLVHILLQLKRAGLLRSIRGAQGGYLLAQPASSITLREVLEAIDGPVLDPLPVEGGDGSLRPIWGDIARRIQEILDTVTVRQLAEQQDSASMYYI